jgi:hypothetical protein
MPPISVDIYPQYRFSPKVPEMNDSVSFQLVKGQYNNSCIPLYVKSFSIKQTSSNKCVRAPCPQDFNITITYKEFAPPYARPCLMVMTEYGPIYNFGILAVGTYTVIDSTESNRVLTRFTVYEKKPAYTLSGMVTEDVGMAKILIPIAKCKVYLKQPVSGSIGILIYPPFYNYTIIDSTLTDAQGHYSFTSVDSGNYALSYIASGYQSKNEGTACSSNTRIDVKLLPDNSYCTISGTVYEATPPGVVGCGISPVGCVVGTLAACTVSVSIPIIMYKSARSSAAVPSYVYNFTAITDINGNYSIDSVQITYMNRSAYVTARKKGFAEESKSVTLMPRSPVTAYFALLRTNTSVRPVALEKLATGKHVLSYSSYTGTLSVNIPKAQVVSVSAFMINGQKAAPLLRKRSLTEGVTKINLKNAAVGTGVIIFKVVGEGFEETLRINFSK